MEMNRRTYRRPISPDRDANCDSMADLSIRFIVCLGKSHQTSWCVQRDRWLQLGKIRLRNGFLASVRTWHPGLGTGHGMARRTDSHMIRQRPEVISHRLQSWAANTWGLYRLYNQASRSKTPTCNAITEQCATTGLANICLKISKMSETTWPCSSGLTTTNGPSWASAALPRGRN